MATTVQVTFNEVDDDIIQEQRLFNVYLIGLPRSGTSMTTHILELLGVNMVYTSEEDKAKTDERFKKKFGEYHANPNGFFEVTKKPLTNFMKILGTPYSGCKMIIPVMGMRWEMLADFPCKVIFMTRDAEEIRQSQMAYYRPQGVEVAYIRTALVTQRMALRESKVDFLEVDYNHLLQNKVAVIQSIADFIRSDRHIQEAVDFVQPSQKRFDKEQIVVGL